MYIYIYGKEVGATGGKEAPAPVNFTKCTVCANSSGGNGALVGWVSL